MTCPQLLDYPQCESCAKNASTVCAGEYVGLEEIDEGIWNVYFGPLTLGRLHKCHPRIEDEYGRPIRHKVSPMSPDFFVTYLPDRSVFPFFLFLRTLYSRRTCRLGSGCCRCPHQLGKIEINEPVEAQSFGSVLENEPEIRTDPLEGLANPILVMLPNWIAHFRKDTLGHAKPKQQSEEKFERRESLPGQGVEPPCPVGVLTSISGI